MAELVRLKVDVIVLSGAASLIQAAKNVTKTIPIIRWAKGSILSKEAWWKALPVPVAVTGITNLGRELGGKRLELLKDAVTTLARVAVLYDPAVSRSVLGAKVVLPSRGACAEAVYSALGRSLLA